MQNGESDRIIWFYSFFYQSLSMFWPQTISQLRKTVGVIKPNLKVFTFRLNLSICWTSLHPGATQKKIIISLNERSLIPSFFYIPSFGFWSKGAIKLFNLTFLWPSLKTASIPTFPSQKTHTWCQVESITSIECSLYRKSERHCRSVTYNYR